MTGQRLLQCLGQACGLATLQKEWQKRTLQPMQLLQVCCWRFHTAWSQHLSEVWYTAYRQYATFEQTVGTFSVSLPRIPSSPTSCWSLAALQTALPEQGASFICSHTWPHTRRTNDL